MSSKQFTAKRLKALTLSAYDQLSEGERNIVDGLRRDLAENLAAAHGMPLDQALEGITTLHERGHLAMVTRNGRVALVPCLDGQPLDGGFDFEAPHRDAGGQS
jgi:hypothetical protein